MWEGEGNVEKDYQQGPVRAQARLETVGRVVTPHSKAGGFS